MHLDYAVFDGCPLPAAFDWVACLDCGSSYYDTPATAAQFEMYYRGNAYYCSAETAGSGGSSPAEQSRFAHTASCIARHCGTDSRVLDVGSGKGGFLSVLKAQGFNRLFAIDMVPECVAYVNQTLGLPAQCAPAERLPFKNGELDCCVYSHVLEHALDPAALLREAWRVLQTNGVVYAEVPDALRYGEMTEFPYAELYLEHVNHFDSAHLASLAASCGFETIESGGKLLDVNGAATVPCVWGLFRKTAPRARETAETIADHKLEQRLVQYTERCGASSTIRVLQDLAANHTPVYVWGMSQYAQLLLGTTALGQCAIRGLVDGDSGKQAKRINGRRVLNPEVLRDAQSNDRIVLTGINYRQQMRRFLAEIGCADREIALGQP
jgi:SAM-dependent methyltransferase